MASSPTQRALADLRKMGWVADVVEKWIPQARRRKDLFGVIDIVAMHDGAGIMGVQATSGSNHAARRTKSMDEPRLRTWLEAGGSFEVWSYAKKKNRWQLRREAITLADL